MRQTITVVPTDTIRMDEDWGYPVGIAIGELHLNIHTEKQVDALIDALSDLRLARHERDLEQERSLNRDCEEQTGDWAGASTLGLPKWVA